MAFTIRGYSCELIPDTTNYSVTPLDLTLSAYQNPPTTAELEEQGGVTPNAYSMHFENCINMLELPQIPNGVTTLTCGGCKSMASVPYPLPSTLRTLLQTFKACRKLVVAPDIPDGVTSMLECFYGCTSLKIAPSIPSSVSNLTSCFERCKALSGSIVINTDITIGALRTDIFKDTSKAIILTGSSTRLAQYADTANNDNVYVFSEPSSTPVWTTPVINRVAGSRTTDTDINRIVGNIYLLGCYPKKFGYTDNDFVTLPEWEIVIAETNKFANELGVAKVTDSTSYINLNKMETIHQLYHEQSE